MLGSTVLWMTRLCYAHCAVVKADREQTVVLMSYHPCCLQEILNSLVWMTITGCIKVYVHCCFSKCVHVRVCVCVCVCVYKCVCVSVCVLVYACMWTYAMYDELQLSLPEKHLPRQSKLRMPSLYPVQLWKHLCRQNKRVSSQTTCYTKRSTTATTALFNELALALHLSCTPCRIHSLCSCL